MRSRPLGATGWTVSEIGLGTYPLGGALQTSGSYWSGPATYGAVARAEAIATVHAALELGQTYIDTAPNYADAESFIGEALRTAPPTATEAAHADDARSASTDLSTQATTAGGQAVVAPRRAREIKDPSTPTTAGGEPDSALTRLRAAVSPAARTYVGTKCGEHVRPAGDGGRPELARDFSRPALRESLARSRERLGVARLDLVLLHSPQPDELSDDPLGLLVELRDRGEIEHIGVSLATIEQGIDLVERDGRAEVLQAPFNLLDPRAAERLLHVAADRGVGIIARVPLASGFLTGVIAEEHVFDADDYRSEMPRESIVRQVRRARRFSWLVDEGIASSMSEAALRYVLSFPAVSTVIAGAMRRDEVRRNAAAAALGPLPEVALRRIAAIQTELGLLRQA